MAVAMGINMTLNGLDIGFTVDATLGAIKYIDRVFFFF